MFGAVVCKPRPVSNETRSRASYITLADASIDRAFSPPRKIALLSSDCADTAWIRLKWNQGEERPSDFSSIWSWISILFRSFSLLSLNFSLSYTIGDSLLARRCDFTEMYLVYVYLVQIFIRQRIFLFAGCAWKERANFIQAHPISFYNGAYLNLIIAGGTKYLRSLSKIWHLRNWYLHKTA